MKEEMGLVIEVFHKEIVAREDCRELKYLIITHQNNWVVGIAPHHVPRGTLWSSLNDTVLYQHDIRFWLEIYYPPSYYHISGRPIISNFCYGGGTILKSINRGWFVEKERGQFGVVSHRVLCLVREAVKEALGLDELE